MRFARRFANFVRNLFRRENVERDLDAEVRAYLDQLAEEKIAAGMSPTEARRAARIELGGVDQVKEQVRGARAGAFLDTLWHDVRFGARQLRRNPGFTAVAVITLALGIGANTAIFSVVNGVLLRPLPFPESDRLVHIASPNLNISVSSEWYQQSTLYEKFAPVRHDPVISNSAEGPERLTALGVTPEFFTLLGVRPLAGRAFLAEDTMPGAETLAILTQKLWQQKFGGQRGIVGRTLVLDKQVHAIVGILPEDFGVLYRFDFDLLLPLKGSDRAYDAYARLRPGVTLESARTEANAIGARLLANSRIPRGGRRLDVNFYKDGLLWSNVRLTLLVLAGAVGFVLLIACVNVANMLLARGAGRDREIAIRSALGAGRRRLLHQLLTESLLLSLLSTAAALLIAHWCTRLLLYLLPYRIPRIEQTSFDVTVFAFATLLAVIASLLCGLFPALQATRIDLSIAFRAGARGAGGSTAHRRIRSALVVTEVAMAMVLLVGAGLLAKTFLLLRPANPGFDASNRLTLRLQLPDKLYPRTALQAAFLRDAAERIRSLPAVRGVAVTTALPFANTGGGNSVTISGKQVSPLDAGDNWTKITAVFCQAISPAYFRVMGIPVVAGRDFTQSDHATGPPVAIINQTMARKYWPDESPLGRRVTLGTVEKGTEYSIVGIVRDARNHGRWSAPRPELYFPYEQAGLYLGYPALVIHSDADPSQLVPAVRAAIRSVGADVLVKDRRMYDRLLVEAVAIPRFNATLMGLLAGLAAVLSVVGIYGVISYELGQRTQEFGVRMALGARPADILRMVLSQVLAVVAVGVVIGLGGAWGLTRYLKSLLYEVPTTDLATFAAITLAWSAAAALACYVSARRVLRVDPIVALRYE
jgi:putative ABC transport system permease protein